MKTPFASWQTATNTMQRIAHVSTIALLVTGIIMAVAPSVHAVTLKAQPMITFTFDDGFQSVNTLAAPALQRHGYTGTSYVISDCVGMVTVPNTCMAKDNAPYMTWAQVKDTHDKYGWEIGSHTKTHPLLVSSDPDFQPTALTEAQAEYELSQSQADILANTGIKPMAFADPYGDYDPAGKNIIPKVAKYYTSMRGFQDTGFNTFPYNDYLLRDQMIQFDNGTDAASKALNITVAAAEKYIDDAIATNQWLVLTFHDIVASGAGATGEYQYNVADLEAIATYAQSKGIKNTNVSDGLAGNPNGANLATNATFDAPVATIAAPTTTDAANWTTDTPTGVKTDAGSHGNTPSATNSAMLSSTSTGTLHLFSPLVPVSPKAYVVKAYVNSQAFSTTSELAFYVDEYDANGTYIASQYKKSLFDNANANVAFGAGYPLSRMYTFEYTPTTIVNNVAVTVSKARLQVTAITGTGATVYIDNIQWFAQDGSTGAAPIPGDIDGNGLVNDDDATVMFANWGTVPGGITTAPGDINHNGVVNDDDATVLFANWSKK